MAPNLVKPISVMDSSSSPQVARCPVSLFCFPLSCSSQAGRGAKITKSVFESFKMAVLWESSMLCLKPPGASFRLLGVRSIHNQVRNLKTCSGALIRASTKIVVAASKMEVYKRFQAAVSTWAFLVPPFAAAHR
jgi:hypothetical protein